MQLCAISMCPIIDYQGEEISIFHSISTPQEVIESNKAFSFLFYKLHKQSVLRLSSQDASSPFTSFVAPLWMLSSILVSFLYCGDRDSIHYSRWDCTNPKYGGRITSFDWLAILRLMHPSMGIALLVARYTMGWCWACCWLEPPDPFLISNHLSPGQNLCLAFLCPSSRLSGSQCKASHPSRGSAVPPILVSSESC